MNFDNHCLRLAPEYKSITIQNQIVWISTYCVHWPEEVKFSAVDFKKKSASHKAAIAALTWLKYNGRVADNGKPIFHAENNVQEEAKQLSVMVIIYLFINK